MPGKNTLNRRDFIKTAAAAAFLAGGVIPLAGCSGDFSTDDTRPNIILITADDL